MSIMQASATLPMPVVTQLQAVFQRDTEADCVALVWPNPLTTLAVEQVVEGRKVRAVYCISELAMREALVKHHQDRKDSTERLVLLSGFAETDLAMDVLARIWRNEPQRISPWKTLQQLIRVRDIDPRLTRKHGRWVAEAMLNGVERYQEKISFGEVLDEETAWRAIAMAHLNYQEATLDLQSVLSWSTKGDVSALFTALPSDVRDNLSDWLARGLPETHELVSTLLLNDQGSDLLPVALACSVLFSSEIEQLHALDLSQLHISRGIFRERYLGGKKIELRMLQPLGDVAVALVRHWIGALGFPSYARFLSKAEQILASLDMQAAAQHSALLPCGLNARFNSFAVALDQALDGGDCMAAESALEQMETHCLAGLDRYSETVARANMAIRLLRWLKLTPTTEGTAVSLIGDYIEQGGFCDWARTEIWAGDADEALSAVYQKLSQQVGRYRERQNQAFGQQLASIARGDHLPARLIPVERTLDDLVAPLAEQGQVLLLVLDGMSEAVYRQLSADLTRNHWLELQPVDAQGDACLVAALPTVTQVSRCSLLSGALCEGNANDEKKAFSGHPQLKKLASTKFPPQVFHKQDLSQSGSGSLHSSVRGVIAGTEHRILAVVINAIDDQLSSSSQVKVDWSFETVALFRHVMEAAREAGRVVIITSDHGHVLDHDSVYQPSADENGERYHPVAPGIAPSELEVLLSGERVVTAIKQVILPWSERLRYTRSKSHGYHGGGSLQEVVIPLGVYINAATRQVLDGWREVPRRLPVWWNSTKSVLGEAPGTTEQSTMPAGVPAKKLAGKKQAVAEVVDDMFGFGAPANTASKSVSQNATSDWIGALLCSPVYRQVRDRAGRTAISDEQMQGLLRLMEEQRWQVMEAALCSELLIPKLRIRGFLAGAQKLLNVDGYPILSVERDSQTIRLNVADLKTQFEIQ
ncbi:BREX-2 system phosphatase PglZ [Pseudomonas sp. BN417]|uniref:BREX-2 system phosphatase PglZ n=1 Tax=Pseudomonas sp. BN417 TaxID=2567890 RepID=UPI0024569EBD|nr:BREX-2 system phosphatase PglZ [Pseudomonas sp. BN417]MDH4555698.1 BREX-2 system phosphatase PglZ [Pseudomonas sp. BN417]